MGLGSVLGMIAWSSTYILTLSRYPLIHRSHKLKKQPHFPIHLDATLLHIIKLYHKMYSL